ncbi:MAG TPA: autotransporter-associated beta strand repeat-containing protein, partial [Prosthecobacter sp.]|nr:autotransporter-associated beta strand repeat-containing protein [Prosthecobacter sp.]
MTRNVGANPITITDQFSGHSISGGFGNQGPGVNYRVEDELIIHQHNPLGPLVLDIPVASLGSSGRLVKAGQGTLILTQPNAYSGQTLILGGVLQVGDQGTSGNLGSGFSDVVNHGYLSFNRLDQADNAFLLGNAITGTGSVRVASGAVQLAGGNSNYTGATSVLSGATLIVSTSNALGSTAGLTTVAGTLALSLGVFPETVVLKRGGGNDPVLSTRVNSATLAGPLYVLSDARTSPENGNAALTLAGQIVVSPGRILTFGGAGSTIITNSNVQIGNTVIAPAATLQIGNNTAGAVGRGSILNNGSLITNTNNGHLVLGATISGSGKYTQARGTVYLTGDNTYTGGTIVGGNQGVGGGTVGFLNVNAELRVGNDTYTGSVGSGPIVVQSSSGGQTNMRYHLIGDTLLNNAISINPWTDASTVVLPTLPTGRNAILLRQGIGNITLAGTITAGSHVVGGGDQLGSPTTQRAFLQAEPGGKLIITGQVVNTPTSRLNIINSGIIDIEGSISNTYHGVLSGNNVWKFNNSGVTTLKGRNTFDTGNVFFQRGTVIIDEPGDLLAQVPVAPDGLHDNADLHVLRGATLQFNYDETIGALQMQTGGTVAIQPGATLTIDDNTNHGIFGSITGGGSVNFNANGGAAWYGLFGTNTFATNPLIGSPTQVATVRVNSLQNSGTASSLGSGNTIIMGFLDSTQEARLEYAGSGHSTNRAIQMQAGTSFTALSNAVTISSTTLPLNNVAGLTVGMTVTGSGIPANTTITAIDANGVTLSASASVPAGTTVTFDGNLSRTAGVPTTATLNVASVTGLSVGMSINGPGIPNGTNITAINGTTLTLSFPATVPAGSTLTFASSTTVRIAANGNGALALNGPISIASIGNKTLMLHGQSTMGNTINGMIDQQTNVISLTVNPNTGNNDLYGAGKWTLTNAANNFSGNITVNVGMLELSGDLKTGTETTSVMGNLAVTRTIDLGTNNFDGRRYDLLGNTDNLNAAGGVTSTGSLIFKDMTAGTATFGSNITFTQSFNSATGPGGGELINNGVKTIVINGRLTAGENGARNWILDGTNTTANTINGVITNGLKTDGSAGASVISILKEGPGTWRLAGANTFTGGVTIVRGTLEISGGSAINNAALVNLTNAGSDGLSTGLAQFTVLQSETIGSLQGAIGAITNIAAGQTLTVTNASDTYSGKITGAGGFTRTDNGTLRVTTLPNKSTYTGATTVATTNNLANRVDVLWLADGGSPSSIGSASSDASNLVLNTGTGGGGLRWIGVGNQSTDRLFTIGSGTSFNTGIWGEGQVFGDVAPSIRFSNTGPIAFTTTNANQTLTLRGPTIAENRFDPQITNNGSGVTTLTKAEAGMWLLTNANTYTGVTTISGGTLAISNGAALGTGAVSVTGGGGVGLQLRGGITVPNAISGTVADWGIASHSGANVMTGTLTLGGTNLGVRVGTEGTSSLEFRNPIVGSVGTARLAKYGPGTLIFSGTNTYAGITSIGGGSLLLNYDT